MSPTAPLVSVIIPAYNAEMWIARTLNSVLEQTYRNLEVLVVDDGSTDQTPTVVTAFVQADPRVKLLCQANVGVASARNLAIAHAKGEFIAPIDADDIWYPENLEKQVQCIVRGGNSVGLVYSWSVHIDECDCPFGVHTSTVEGNVLWMLICQYFLGNGSATLIRRSCLDAVGAYEPALKAQQAQGCEDWDLYLRIAAQYEFRVVPEILVGYRKLSNSMSCDFSQMARSHQLTMQTVQQNSPDVPGLLYRLSASNFYLYFAHQCSSRGNDRQALNWLLKALQAECVTPLIRPGFYRLLLKSGLGLIRRSSTQPSQSLQPSQGKYSQQFDPSQYQPDVLFRDPKIWADRMLYQIMTLGTLYLTKILQLYRLAFKQ